MEDPPPGYPPPQKKIAHDDAVALWSHICIVVMEDTPPGWLPPPHMMDGSGARPLRWLSVLVFSCAKQNWGLASGGWCAACSTRSRRKKRRIPLAPGQQCSLPLVHTGCAAQCNVMSSWCNSTKGNNSCQTVCAHRVQQQQQKQHMDFFPFFTSCVTQPVWTRGSTSTNKDSFLFTDKPGKRPLSTVKRKRLFHGQNLLG